MKKITLALNSASINKAIKEIQNYKKNIEEKGKLLCERLAVIGAREASVRFTTAMYDGVNDVSVEVVPTEKGYSIIAKGKAVAFIEFGAGVYYNPSEPYPKTRPKGVVGIGEYGKGKGKETYEDGSPKPWYYAHGKKSYGNPAAMPMWYATQEIEREIRQIAQEVFGK